MSMDILAKIFGRKNHDLINIIFDHANSNYFFGIITKHYQLEKRVSRVPKGNNKLKSRADIFEAWVGGHVYEWRQYNDGDILLELRSFLNQLLTVRYRELAVFFYNPTANRDYIPRGEIKQVTITPVNCCQDLLFQRILGRFVEAPNVKRDVGHLVRLKIEQPKRERALF